MIDPVTVTVPCSLCEAMVYLAPGNTKSVCQVDFADQVDVVPSEDSVPLLTADDELDFQ